MANSLVFHVCFLLCASAVLSATLGTSGFRPGKKVNLHSASMAHHATKSHLHQRHLGLDLEKDAAKAEAEEEGNSAVEAALGKFDGLVQSFESDMGKLKEDFEQIKEFESQIKAAASHTKHSAPKAKVEEKESDKLEAEEDSLSKAEEEPKAEKESVPVTRMEEDDVVKTEEKKSEDGDSFERADAEDAIDAFLETSSTYQDDNMNNAMSEDDDSVPSVLTERMMKHHSLLQNSLSQSKFDPDKSYTFGVSNDGSGRTFDVTPDGDTIIHPPPEMPEGVSVPNDAKYRTEINDPSFRDVQTVPIDPSQVYVNADMPGTSGKQWSVKAGANSTTEEDSVCVCKRRGAPRGEDRVRCKKHPSASPHPSPPPQPPIEGIRQCVNGTWLPSAAPGDANTRDVICIYYPVQVPLPSPPPLPTPTPEPEYPPECYDERNEFVADGVIKKRFDMVLLQQGFEKCDC